MSRCLAVRFYCILLLATFAVGQSPTFSAIESHEVDSINLQNLTVLLSAPTISKSGAFPFSFTLNGSSSCIAGTSWYCGIGLLKESSVGYVLKGIGTGIVGYTAMSTNAIGNFYYCPDGVTETLNLSGWVIVDNFGIHHPLPPGDYVDEWGCTSHNSFIDHTTDGSGLTLSIHAANPLTSGYSYIYASNGMVTNGGTYGPQLTNSAETDTNGNSITANYEQSSPYDTTWTDTLGLTALTSHDAVTNGYGYYKWTDVNGGTQDITESFSTSSSIKTYFDCTGIADTNVTGKYLVTKLNYPDGTNIGFSYETNSNGSYTGRIAGLTLRTGGSVTYAYSGGNNGINCTYQVPPSMTRTTSDGTATYTWALLSGNNGNTTTVTDNGGNKTVYTFTGLTATGNAAPPIIQALTQVQRYQGSSTLLSTDVYCYNGASGQPSNCANAVVSEPITEVDVYHTIPNLAAGSSRAQTQYDGGPTASCASGTSGCYGNVTYSAQYDFGATTPTVTTTTTYGSWNGSTCVAVSITINNKPCQVVTTQGGNTVGYSRFTYGSTGNLLTSYVSPNGGSTFLSNSAQNVYNPNGAISTSYDLAGNSTTYAYLSSGYTSCTSCTNFPFPTSVTKGGLTTSSTWNGVGGVKVTDVGPNGSINQKTIYGYVNSSGTADPFWRVKSVTDPLSNTVWKTYPSGSYPDTLNSSFTFNSNASIQNTTTTTDGYGRTVNVQTQQSPTSTSYDTVSTQYGWFDHYRWVTTSLPCTTTSGGTCGSTHANYFDPLGRLYQGITNSSETVTNTFTQNDELRVLSPAPANENNKQVQKQYDGLGRLQYSCAIGSVSGSAACSQNTGSSSGVTTSYSYRSNNVGQTGVYRTRGSQTRSRTYDSLGRVVGYSTPEGGNTTYTYDVAGGCTGAPAYPGQLVLTTYANGISICYEYDGLGRVVNEGSTYSGTNLCKRFRYDSTSNGVQSAPSGSTITNVAGRLVEAETDNCTWPSPSPITDEWFSYDNDGNQIGFWELTPHSTQYYYSTALFAGNKQITSLVLASPSISTETYGLDGEGRWKSLTSGTKTVVSATTYNAASQPITIALGTSTDQDSYLYDPNTGRMTNWTFQVGSTLATETGALTWNPNGTLNNLALTDGFNAGGTQTCYFNPSSGSGMGYDDLGRLLNDNCGSAIWAQTFSYDQYDNLTKSGSMAWSPGYSSSTNQYMCSGCTYDASGNATNDSFNSYAWDPYNKMASVNSTACGTSGQCATYDAFGRMVDFSKNSTYTENWYTQAGTVVMSGTTLAHAYLRSPGGGTFLEFGGASDYLHKDWLGNARIASLISGQTVSADMAYAPYGEVYNSISGTGSDWMFTGDLTQLDSEYLFDTPNREFAGANQGRWLSPDPAGQGWNQYAYSTNPNSNIDPSGLMMLCVPCLIIASGGGYDNDPFFGSLLGSNAVTFGTVSSDNGSCSACSSMIPNLITGQMQPIGSPLWGVASAIFQDFPENSNPNTTNDVDSLEDVNPETDWERAIEPTDSVTTSIGWPPPGAYSPDNPGPLSSLPPQYADSFDWYIEVTLSTDTTYYRAWGDPAGMTGSGAGTFYSYFDPGDLSTDLYRDQFSLPSEWNSLTNLDAVTIPAGTSVFLGPAASQQGYSYPGGGLQVFVLNP
jgi:RHS repeat-associated protein